MRLFVICLVVQILFGKVTDCDGLEPQGVKCTQDEQDWTQCYEMPKEFLCLMSDEETDLELKFLNSQNQVEVMVNEEVLIVSLGGTGHGLIHLKASEKLKIASSNQIRFGLNTCGSNCDECNVTCSRCSSNYMLYNYQCVEEGCLNQISQISEASLVSNVGELIGTDYLLTINFKFPLGSCLIPHVYLTNGLFEGGIKQILPANFRDNELQTQLSQSQYMENCQKIELKELTIYQCYIGVAVTFQDITQYQMISINKIEMQTTTTTSQSVFVSNDPNYEVGPIEIVSLIKNVVNQGSKIIATQEIADPNYYNYQFNFIEGTAWQGKYGFIFDLISQSYSGHTITYEFKWQDLEFKPNEEFNLEIVSEMTKSSKRLLLSDRSQLKVILLASSKLLINQKESKYTEQSNLKNNAFGYWYIIGGSVFLLCALGVVVIQMFRKPINAKLE